MACVKCAIIALPFCACAVCLHFYLLVLLFINSLFMKFISCVNFPASGLSLNGFAFFFLFFVCHLQPFCPTLVLLPNFLIFHTFFFPK